MRVDTAPGWLPVLAFSSVLCGMQFSMKRPLRTLQTLRLAQALSEAGGTLCVKPQEADVFRYLEVRLPLSWTVGEAERIALQIDHSIPRTRVGLSERAVIFPTAAVARCRSLWSERPVSFVFAGLLTRSRLEQLSAWSQSSGGRAVRAPGRIRDRMSSSVRLRGLPLGATVWSSRRGRTYPTKAWDDGYFELLAGSQFTLCPPGDFVWTYRVFEACLCGSIPVADEWCDAYGDLVHYPMAADARSLTWSAEVAEHNFEEATRLVTVKREELLQSLQRALLR